MCSLSLLHLNTFKNKHTLSDDIVDASQNFNLNRNSQVRPDEVKNRKDFISILLDVKMWIVVLVLSFVSSRNMVQGFEIEENNFPTSNTINKPVQQKTNHQPWLQFSAQQPLLAEKVNVRCFCNMPACVTTGYMCKSSGGTCFSDLWGSPSSPSGYRSRHGCLELLSERDQKSKCQNPQDNETGYTTKKNHPKSLLVCCYKDLCNHIDNPQTKNIINNTILGDENRQEDNNRQQSDPSGYSSSEVWFRAATIAVPICGAVILFVLIALAVKILRSEHQNSYDHKLGPAMYVHHVHPSDQKPPEKHRMDHQAYDIFRRQYAPPSAIYRPTTEELHTQQVPLLVQNETNAKKNDVNAKMNLMHCEHELCSGKAIYVELGKKPAAECSHLNNLAKNINDGEFKIYEKDNNML